jgi:hypothetical protein
MATPAGTVCQQIHSNTARSKMLLGGEQNLTCLVFDIMNSVELWTEVCETNQNKL